MKKKTKLIIILISLVSLIAIGLLLLRFWPVDKNIENGSCGEKEFCVIIETTIRHTSFSGSCGIFNKPCGTDIIRNKYDANIGDTVGNYHPENCVLGDVSGGMPICIDPNADSSDREYLRRICGLTIKGISGNSLSLKKACGIMPLEIEYKIGDTIDYDNRDVNDDYYANSTLTIVRNK